MGRVALGRTSQEVWGHRQHQTTLPLLRGGGQTVVTAGRTSRHSPGLRRLPILPTVTRGPHLLPVPTHP